MRWSLDELYSDFESEEYKNDFERLEKLIEGFTDWAENELNLDGDKIVLLEDYIKFSEEILTTFIKLRGFASLSSSVDARDEKAIQEMDKLSLVYTNLTKPEVDFKNFLKEVNNLDELINESELLKEHRFILKDMKEDTKYLLSEKEEILISKMKNTGSNAWGNLQNQLSSKLLVDIVIDEEEKKLPLSVVRNLAYSKDSQVRKLAYYAEIKAYKKIEESSAAALNGIKGEVITVSKLRGFQSPLDETLVKSRMDKKTLDAMIDAMEEFLPVFHKYFKKKAEILGHRDGLPFYGIFAPIGEVDMRFTYDEAINYIVKNFNKFSEKLGSFVQEAYDKNWLDVEPREGKRGGAFCSNLHPIGESRILSNFDGSFSNMTTLAHELGHAYHGSTLMDESILNSSYPMPIAETASIFCETIVVNAALENISKEEALSILESSISDAAQVIVDIYSRFVFESMLFAARESHPLSVTELKETMMEAQKKAYGDGLDHSLLHPYMWINKPHYYSASLNFYNFPYAFGLLFSKGLYAEYLKRGDEFVKEYDALLNATGKNNIRDVALRMNIDIHNPEFFRNSLKLIESDIEKFISLA
ncbi:M3 family oligoendopeptidase [Tissierella creatinophila]|uniref:Oligoendopeptidase F, plasmid n=1 Tax=Tissierella creatinophila DSM 6911 TaxID=1123403 RepID=A0A1U7M8W4_TISCR|nr:M3 family oligoendopeptidase [Tissierella creatinophila]OLS03725.1 oligoendopeptidase F, plasmid [Tissierella creatinophila DSM 6911]